VAYVLVISMSTSLVVIETISGGSVVETITGGSVIETITGGSVIETITGGSVAIHTWTATSIVMTRRWCVVPGWTRRWAARLLRIVELAKG